MLSHPEFQVKRLDRRFSHNKIYGFTIYLDFEEFPDWRTIEQIQNMLVNTYGEPNYSRESKEKCGWNCGFVTPKSKPPRYRITLRDENMLAYIMMIL
jgi:hypothetical protein